MFNSLYNYDNVSSYCQEKEYNFTIFVTDGVQATEVPSTLIVTESERAILSPFLDYQTIYTINEVM